MPRNVQLFERLAYGSILVGALVLLLQAQHYAVEGGWPVLLQMYALAALTAAIPVYLIARRRKKWARNLFAMAVIFGLLRYFPQLMTMVDHNKPAAVLSFAQFVMQATAMALVFSPEAQAWFEPETQPGSGPSA